MPKSFVFLNDIDDSIVHDIRNYGRHNILGRRVVGYETRSCILTLRAARALENAQIALTQHNLALKVYDCYRPQRAVTAMVAWTRDAKALTTKREFYPTMGKSDLLARHYLVRRSAHSRGSTVAAAIVPMPILPQRPYRADTRLEPCHGLYGLRFVDNALDFGTAYGCFHPRSATDHPGVSRAARDNRALLVRTMQRAGFKNNKQKWWSFTLKNEPYPRTYFDFPVARGNSVTDTPRVTDTPPETRPLTPGPVVPKPMVKPAFGPQAPGPAAPGPDRVPKPQAPKRLGPPKPATLVLTPPKKSKPKPKQPPKPLIAPRPPQGPPRPSV